MMAKLTPIDLWYKIIKIKLQQILMTLINCGTKLGIIRGVIIQMTIKKRTLITLIPTIIQKKALNDKVM